MRSDTKRSVVKKLPQLFALLGFAAFGAAIALVAIAPNVESSQGAAEVGEAHLILQLVILISAFYFGVFVHVVVHEAGHLIGGLISGYNFLLFRVFSFALVKENNKLKRKRQQVAGTAGQCVLSPPNLVNGVYPYVLYNVSGGLANIVLSSVFYVLYVVLRDTMPFAGVLFIPLVSIGILLSAMNLLPLKISGVTNDGHNLLSLRKSETARRAFYCTLRVGASLTEGIRYRDMPEAWFELPGSYDNSLSVSSALLHLSVLLDRHEFKVAKAFAEETLVKAAHAAELYKNELRSELLFLEIITEHCLDKIEELFTNDLKKYLKASRSQPSKIRLTYAYQKLVLRNESAAKKELAAFNKACLTAPYRGEIVFERELIEVVDTIAQASTRM